MLASRTLLLLVVVGFTGPLRAICNAAHFICVPVRDFTTRMGIDILLFSPPIQPKLTAIILAGLVEELCSCEFKINYFNVFFYIHIIPFEWFTSRTHRNVVFNETHSIHLFLNRSNASCSCVAHFMPSEPRFARSSA